MGDCRLRILVSKALLEKDSIISITECESFSKVYSADTTIREVMQDDGLLVDVTAAAAAAAASTATTSVSSTTTTTTIRNVLSLLQDGRAKLWDCTKHPPQDITQWPLSLYSEIGGPQSKTLYDAGWYPSGSLQVLPFEVEYPPMASLDAYDDVQYNSKTSVADESLNAQKRVATTSSSSSQHHLRPSQLLESVTHRFDHDDTVRTDHHASEAASLLRQQNKLAARQKEMQRHQRLEARIRKLQEKQQESSSSAGSSSSNNSRTVSEQVRRMLIKSRATGRANLEQQDRVYLHCLMDDCTTTPTTALGNNDEDSPLQEDYLYFSKQDTVGTVLSALKSKVASSSNCANAVAELIVATKQNKKGDNNAAIDGISGGTGLYQRLSVLMRLYEAISLGYLQPVDEVVLRIYDPSKEDATASIDIIDKTPADLVTAGNDASAPMSLSDSNRALPLPSGQQPLKSSTLGKREIESSVSNYTVVNARLGQALQVMDQNENKGKKKKVSVLKESAAVQKVKQMKIKSQAKGDAKRVKEMSDRFFVQLVTAAVDDSGNNNITCNLSLVFCSQRDTLDRLFRDCAKAPAPTAASVNQDDWEWDFLTEDDHDDLDDDDDDALLDAMTTPLSHHRFRRLDKKCTKSVSELESEGHVQNFGRLIVLFTKKSTGAK